MARRVTLAVDSMTSFSGKPLLASLLLPCCSIVFRLWWAARLFELCCCDAESGFTTVILLMLLTGSAILTGLCISSAYLHHAFVELKGRPRYLLAETLEGDKTDA